jgi:hypothetical protein
MHSPDRARLLDHYLVPADVLCLTRRFRLTAQPIGRCHPVL